MTIPSIDSADDWKSWARKLSVFLSSQEDRGGRPTTPTPILLAHSTDEASNIGLERAFTDGILLFDPVNRMIILSRDNGWRLIFDAATVASIFNAAAYGSMGMSVPTAGSDIPVGSFIPVTQFDVFPTSSRGIVFDFGTDTFSFNFEGLFRISIMFSIEHNDLNAGRQFELRPFNITDVIAGQSTIIGVSRNTAVTNFTASFLIDIPASNVDDAFRLDVGNADTILTSVVWETLNLSIDMVSEWRESITALEAPGP